MEKIDITAARFYCLVAAILIYAVLGSPTPDAPGLVELIVASLLILATGLSGLYNVLKPEGPRPLWLASARMLLIYGLTCSLITGVVRGHDHVHILRDLAPFLFFLLPLFLHDIFKRRPEYIPSFIAAIIFAGLVFSCRAAPEIIGWWNDDYKGELYYFANAPSVLFTALFLAGFGAQAFVQKLSWRSVIVCAACFLFALFPLTAATMTLQRATIGMFGAMLGALVLAGFYRYPSRTILLLLIIGAALLPSSGRLQNIQTMFAHKSEAVGLNMRTEEVAAAWHEISGSPVSLFFGTGWGGTFESPAVGGVRVNYTHSLLSAMLLKTGLFGLTLTFGYLVGLAHILTGGLVRQPRNNIVLVLAIAGPILIDVFLYASYKSLDFGLILLLAAVSGLGPVAALKVASPRRVLYSNLYPNAF